LKENFQKFTNGYDIVEKADTYFYNLKSDLDKNLRLGMIAHELQEAGQSVGVQGKKDETDGPQGLPIYQRVNYITLVPTLWSALKKCMYKIECLEKRVGVLENEK
jgi:hypothetical protein